MGRRTIDGSRKAPHLAAAKRREGPRVGADDERRILDAGGGYILAACRNVQSVRAPENIVAVYETGCEHGRTRGAALVPLCPDSPLRLHRAFPE